MAAGRGTRMRSSTPKVLHKVAGTSIAQHVIKAVKGLAPAQVVLVVPGNSTEEFQGGIGDDVECVEQPDPLGTGDALRLGLAAVNSDVDQIILVNGDLPLIRAESLQKLLDEHVAADADLTLLSSVRPTNLAMDLGKVIRNDQGLVVSIEESTSRDGSNEAIPLEPRVEINVGAYCIKKSWLANSVQDLKMNTAGEYPVTELVSLATQSDAQVQAVPLRSDLEGIGVNTRLDLAVVEGAMQERLRTHWILNGVGFEDPPSVSIDSEVQIEADVRIRSNTQLRGKTSIASGTIIGPNANLTDVSIQENCIIGASTLDGVTIEANVQIGPYCHLRENTYLSSSSRIGSHVETKNTRIGTNSTVAHFCYLGDTTIGENVNIGAGTVTCNFDGKTKHQTHINDGAFIGSSTMLIAPITIGFDSATGAGSVVKQDVPDGTTVAGVPAKEINTG